MCVVVYPVVSNLTAEYSTLDNHITTGNSVTFILNMTKGDMTSFTFNFSDGETLQIDLNPPNPLAGDTYRVSHVYTSGVLGTQWPSVHWVHNFNSGWTGSQTLQYNSVIIEQQPASFSVVSSSYMIEEFQTVTFSVGVTQGTHLSYLLDYGDGDFGIMVQQVDSSHSLFDTNTRGLGSSQ